VITVNASMSRYLIEIQQSNQFTATKKKQTTRTEVGREFVKLVNLPNLVIKDNQIEIDTGVTLTPKSTREVREAQKLEWLLEHDFFFDVITNQFRPISTIQNQTISADQIGATCRGLPQLLSMSNGKKVIGAVGTLNINNVFSGVFEYEAS